MSAPYFRSGPPCPLLKHGNETLQQRCRSRAAADVQVDRHHIRVAPDTGIRTPTAVALKRCPGCPAPSPDPPPRISTMCRSMVAADGSSLLSNSSPARFEASSASTLFFQSGCGSPSTCKARTHITRPSSPNLLMWRTERARRLHSIRAHEPSSDRVATDALLDARPLRSSFLDCWQVPPSPLAPSSPRAGAYFGPAQSRKICS